MKFFIALVRDRFHIIDQMNKNRDQEAQKAHSHTRVDTA